MRVEAVSVCVNYADFLNVTAEYNRGLFDRWVIVTSEKDEETREVCRKYNLEMVLTNDFYKEGPNEFCKSRGINRGVEQLSADCWHLHLDSDMILPSNFKNLLELASLSMNCIYGIDRIMIKSWEEWVKLRDNLPLWHDYYYRCQIPVGYDIGTRWVSPFYGYAPIGAFQLWHSYSEEWKGIKIRRYGDKHANAARTDIKYSLSYDRNKRALIPELLGIHLESEKASLGANWKGRKTKRFGPDTELVSKTAGPCS